MDAAFDPALGPGCILPPTLSVDAACNNGENYETGLHLAVLIGWKRHQRPGARYWQKAWRAIGRNI
jgi:hypothetical protein